MIFKWDKNVLSIITVQGVLSKQKNMNFIMGI